jgi:hypothetical protein
VGCGTAAGGGGIGLVVAQHQHQHQQQLVCNTCAGWLTLIAETPTAIFIGGLQLAISAVKVFAAQSQQRHPVVMYAVTYAVFVLYRSVSAYS